MFYSVTRQVGAPIVVVRTKMWAINVAGLPNHAQLNYLKLGTSDRGLLTGRSLIGNCGRISSMASYRPPSVNRQHLISSIQHLGAPD